MPGMLTAGQLSFLQTKAATTLDLVANTTRKSGTATDGRGHQVPAWAASLTGVACGMSEPAASDLQKYPELFIGAERRAKFSFPTGSDIKPDDRITIVASGQAFRVQVRTDRDSYSLLVQCLGVQVETTVN